ncbi:MAG: ABC transporter permease [Propionivibrio sp.]|jgi:ribose/xylose/arabinose/galactoside ABC-type transport system permease subunit|uniref:ABC transporter permease n=1 Tax=Propionivibrio sp. TaxID=2212460 RepID=UPI001B562237|nr:ABC transporter permease [Propionivibrio sp.]MBP7204184.1 ABC transporter permease [Propionivibrio sp.]
MSNTSSERADTPLWGRLKKTMRTYGQETVVLFALVFLVVVVGLSNPNFLSATNLNNIVSGNAYVAVAAIGMSMVILLGHIDVSVGALIGVLASVSGLLAVGGAPIWVAWCAPLVIGVVVNTVVGVLVAYARIPAIVTTLGVLSILKGGLITATAGVWISNLPPDFLIAQFRLFGVPSPVYFMVILTAIVAVWMRYSALGRAIYASGGNPEAARTVGIRPERMTVFVFALHGFFVGIAAVLFGTQLQVIQSTVPSNLELTIITASVIGGVSILGGRGTVVGSTIAAVFFAAVSSALVFMNISAYWLRAVLGLLILATVLADAMRRRQFQ